MSTHRQQGLIIIKGVKTSGRQAWARVCTFRLAYIVMPTHSRRTAYIYGLEFCTGDFVIIMDADFSHHVCTSSADIYTILKFFFWKI
jgi:hypothetical protein